MMKNSFFNIQRRTIFTAYRNFKYLKKIRDEKIILKTTDLYKVKTEEELFQKLKETSEDKNYQEFLKYCKINPKLMTKTYKSQIDSLKKDVELNYENILLQSVHPIISTYNIYRKDRSLFWSKCFHLAFFIIFFFYSFDLKYSYFSSLFKYWYIKSLRKFHNFMNYEEEKPISEVEKKLEETVSEKGGIKSLFENDSEFRLAKNVPDRLADVKGIDEVKDEIQEIVHMLKDPQKYADAGAKLIRGVLLVGQPGTGKTLLARAVAGESGINFIYLTASEFEQSIVGMGTVKLKKLFKYARKNSPCIIFIDEIDSLLHKGKRSGKYTNSSERSVINTFLNEMDGFKPRDHVFVMGATNFVDNLDSAALRPGRFDKIINVPIPDTSGRKEIFDLYIKKIKLKLKEDIDTQVLSKMTPGFTGAEIANMVNHAVISAVDNDSTILSKKEFEDARDRIILGLIKKSGFKTEKQLLYSAIHEAGHTLICYLNSLCRDSIFKVSVIPRGSNNKGKTSTLSEDREGTKEEFLTMIDMSLGGVLAEEIYFGTNKVTPGCGNDLSRAAGLAKSMVKKYGMNSVDWGYMVVEDAMEIEHRIGSNTRDSLDTASQKIIESSEKRVRNILTENLDLLKDLAQKLCEYEELNKDEVDAILSGKPFQKNSIKKSAKRVISISSIAI